MATETSARAAMRFRPCIDIHAGEVKQIVGSTLSDAQDSAPVTNFVASQSAGEFAACVMKRAARSAGAAVTTMTLC